NSLCSTQQQAVFSIVSVKTAKGHFPMFAFSSNSTRMIESKRIGQLGFYFCKRQRPGTTVLQQLCIVISRMTDCPVGKEYRVFIHTGSLYQQRGNCAVYVGFADNRETFVKQQRVCTARHNTQFILKCIPALDNCGIAAIL